MAPKRIWDEDALSRRIVSLSDRMLRVRALVTGLDATKRETLSQALFSLEQCLDEVQPSDPEGQLLVELHKEMDRRKIPVAQIARELDISRQSLHAIFTGRSHLGPRMTEKLSLWLSKSKNRVSFEDL